MKAKPWEQFQPQATQKPPWELYGGPAEYITEITVRPGPEPDQQPLPGRFAGGQEEVGSGFGGVYGGLQGVTFNTIDEIYGGIDALIAKAKGDERDISEIYTEAHSKYNNLYDKAKQDSPTATMAGEIGGAVLSAAIPGTQVLKGASLLGKSARGAAAGAGYGALTGFNSGMTLDDRVNRAQTGAGVGMFLGGGFPVVGQAVGGAYRGIRNSGALTNAARSLKSDRGALNRVAQSYGDDAALNLVNRAGKDDMLLNQSPQLLAQAEAIATQPGKGQSMLLDAVKRQSDNAGNRVTSVVDDVMGVDAGRVVERNAVAVEKKAAGKVYDAAKAAGDEFDLSVFDNRFKEVARDAAGTKFAKAMKQFSKMPAFTNKKATAQQLHAARQDVDSRIGVSMRSGDDVLGRQLQEVRDILDKNLKSIDDFASADRAYSSIKKGEDALEAGKAIFTKRGGSPQELYADLVAMTPKTRIAFKKGVRDAVTEMMGTARFDAAKAKQVILDQGWNREKLTVLLGARKAKTLLTALESEGNKAAAKQALDGGSRTAPRAAAQKAFPSAVNRNAKADQLAQQGVGGLFVRGTFKALDTIAGGFLTARNTKISENAAKLLKSSGIERQKVERVLQDIVKKGGKAKSRAEIVELLTNSIGLGGGQVAERRGVFGFGIRQ